MIELPLVCRCIGQGSDYVLPQLHAANRVFVRYRGLIQVLGQVSFLTGSQVLCRLEFLALAGLLQVGAGQRTLGSEGAQVAY